MKFGLFGSACGADVTAPQISRFKSGSRAGLPPLVGNAVARSTVPRNLSRKRTVWPPNSFGTYRSVKVTMAVAYSGSSTRGVPATMAASEAGKVAPIDVRGRHQPRPQKV